MLVYDIDLTPKLTNISCKKICFAFGDNEQKIKRKKIILKKEDLLSFLESITE